MTFSIFGDLRLLRHEVLHNKGRLTKRTRDRLEVVDVGSAAAVNLNQEGAGRLVFQVKAALDDIVQGATGENPGYSTEYYLE